MSVQRTELTEDSPEQEQKLYRLVVSHEHVVQFQRMDTTKQCFAVLATDLTLEQATMLLELLRKFLSTLSLEGPTMLSQLAVRRADVGGLKDVMTVQTVNQHTAIMHLDLRLMVGAEPPYALIFTSSLAAEGKSFATRAVVLTAVIEGNVHSHVLIVRIPDWNSLSHLVLNP